VEPSLSWWGGSLLSIVARNGSAKRFSGRGVAREAFTLEPLAHVLQLRKFCGIGATRNDRPFDT
jgi:hypothetical protein